MATEEMGTESTGNLWSLPLELTIDVGRAVSGVGLRAEAGPGAPAHSSPSLTARQNGGDQSGEMISLSMQPAGNGREMASAVALLESTMLLRTAPATAARAGHSNGWWVEMMGRALGGLDLIV